MTRSTNAGVRLTWAVTVIAAPSKPDHTQTAERRTTTLGAAGLRPTAKARPPDTVPTNPGTHESRAMTSLAQVAQHADDLDRAAAFYTELLGVEPAGRFDPPGLVFFNLGGARLLLDRAAPSALFYLSVSDVRTEVERLRSAGVEIDTEPHVIFHHDDDSIGPAGTDEWMAFIRDSEGNLVGLVSHHALPHS